MLRGKKENRENSSEAIAVTQIVDGGGPAQVAAVEMTGSRTVLVSHCKERRPTECAADWLWDGKERKESDVIYRVAGPLEE